MKKIHRNLQIALCIGVTLLSVLACNMLAPTAAASPVPSPLPPTATSAPLLSQQVTLVPQAINETNQAPPFTITTETPQLVGSNDPRVIAFNQQLNELVTKEVDMWRQSFLQNTAPVVNDGSTLNVTYTLITQTGDLWSFKLDFDFYSDGAAHPGLYSITLNYDLGQGRELALSDLFLPDSNYLYLEAISNYCIAELSKQPFFEGPFAEGAQPTLENYRNWNITPVGLLITFDEYQVAPYAAGPQTVTVPYDRLQGFINPEGPAGRFTQ